MGTAMAEFALAATLLILAPGPDSMLVLRNALRGGRRVGFSTAAATVTGLMSWAVAAVLGISALLATSRVGYDTLRFAGGAYLVGLGIVTLRRRGSLSHRTPEEGALERGAPHHGAQQDGVTTSGAPAHRDRADDDLQRDAQDRQKGDDKVARPKAVIQPAAGRRPNASLRRAYSTDWFQMRATPK